jgi:hypothetical protein
MTPTAAPGPCSPASSARGEAQLTVKSKQLARPHGRLVNRSCQAPSGEGQGGDRLVVEPVRVVHVGEPDRHRPGGRLRAHAPALRRHLVRRRGLSGALVVSGEPGTHSSGRSGPMVDAGPHRERLRRRGAVVVSTQGGEMQPSPWLRSLGNPTGPATCARCRSVFSRTGKMRHVGAGDLCSRSGALRVFRGCARSASVMARRGTGRQRTAVEL